MQGGIIMDEKFCDYFDRWVKEFKEGNIREVTLDKYYCTSKGASENSASSHDVGA